MLIKEMLASEKPRERLLKVGASNMANEELLSLIMRSGTKNTSVKEVSANILSHISSIYDLQTLSLEELSLIKGVGIVKAMSIIAAIELGKRIVNPTDISCLKLNSTQKVFKYFQNYFQGESQEKFIVLFLDVKKNLIAIKELFKGTIDQSVVHPREIFKWAFKKSASAIICVHNHPSGDVTPSEEDCDFTLRLISISHIMGISFLDHLIVSASTYYSFLEHGELQC